MGEGAKSVQRFERSDGLDIALYKNYIFMDSVSVMVRVSYVLLTGLLLGLRLG